MSALFVTARTPMHVIVLGAGVAGVATAWYLRAAGARVTVIERQPGAALETSFANGGQISVSHPEPWSSPATLRQLPGWLLRRDAPIRVRPRLSPAQWSWALAFLHECGSRRHQRNTRATAALARHSLACLRALRAELDLPYDAATLGTLHLFRGPQATAEAHVRAAHLRTLAIRAEALDRTQLLAQEPALATAHDIVAAIHAPDDESGDVHLFTTALAVRAAQAGVDFRYATTVLGLEHDGQRMHGVRVRCSDATGSSEECLRADHSVLCLASASRLLLPRVAGRLPIWPLHGHSLTLPIRDPTQAPRVSLTDEARRIVCTRLGGRLRVAGMAELAGMRTPSAPLPVDAARCAQLLRWAEEMFGESFDAAEAEFWSGARPATPSNLPRIGPSRLGRLWFNCGHGSLGWTLACGSAQALAELLHGRSAPVAGFPFSGAA